MQKFRETIAANKSRFALNHPETAKEVDGLLAKALEPGTHIADVRRAANRMRELGAQLGNKADFDQAKDDPALQSILAAHEMLQTHLGNMEAAEPYLRQNGRTGSSGWYDAATGEELRVLAPNEPLARARPADQARQGDITVGTVLAGIIFGPKNDRQRNALTSTTPSEGGYTVPEWVVQEYIDKLRAATRFVQAGARTVPINGITRMVKLTGDPTAGWRGENDDFAEGDPTFGAITLTPKSLGTIVKVPYELLADSVNIEDILQDALIKAMSVKLDQACLFGSGSGDEPLGLYNASGINTVSMGTNGATPTNYDDLIDAIYEIENANGTPPTAAIWSPRTAKTYRKLKDSTGQPLMMPQALENLPLLGTKSVPDNLTQGTATTCSTILLGDYSQAMIGLREGLTLMRLNERYAEKGQVAFMARMRADVAFAQPACFTRIIGVKP